MGRASPKTTRILIERGKCSQSDQYYLTRDVRASRRAAALPPVARRLPEPGSARDRGAAARPVRRPVRPGTHDLRPAPPAAARAESGRPPSPAAAASPTTACERPCATTGPTPASCAPRCSSCSTLRRVRPPASTAPSTRSTAKNSDCGRVANSPPDMQPHCSHQLRSRNPVGCTTNPWRAGTNRYAARRRRSSR